MSSATQSDESGNRSARLTLNLSSNNPFRNRAASPSSLPRTPASPFDDPPPRPVSRNPFLDPANKPAPQPLISTDTMASKSERMSPSAEELFDSLTLDDKDGKKPAPSGSGRPSAGRSGPPRGENVPPPGGRRPPPNHRPTRSQEEAMRARRLQGSSGHGNSSSPHRRPDRRLRRNSESSVISADKEKPLTEEEKKARDLRRKDRERRHRERGERDSKSKPKPTNRKLDIIDQLDATSIFGTGLFHHDGPFDALNPHRNKKGSSRAPMQAFPKDSLNNSMGGSGPLNARPDHATFMGNADQEAFLEYSNQNEKPSSSSRLPPVFDPMSRGSILHGDESMGLGTSTFLEGTPAARTVIERREAEQQQDTAENGLQRKMSLAQRIRGINRPRRDFEPSGRLTNPDGAYQPRRSPAGNGTFTSSSVSSSRGERNPFFTEYDGANNGEESISVRKTDVVSPRIKSPTSPAPVPLERRATTEDEQGSKPGSGLLARVKSLKGGRRTRPNLPDQPAPAAVSTSGTAV